MGVRVDGDDGTQRKEHEREGDQEETRHRVLACVPSLELELELELNLIIAAHRGFNIVPFQEVYSTAMQHGSRPTTGAIGGLREGFYDGPRCR